MPRKEPPAKPDGPYDTEAWRKGWRHGYRDGIERNPYYYPSDDRHLAYKRGYDSGVAEYCRANGLDKN